MTTVAEIEELIKVYEIEARTFKQRHYIAWDGEGITTLIPERSWQTPDGIVKFEQESRHDYVLMKNSEGGRLVAKDGVSTRDALDLLWQTHHDNPHAWHVIFAGSYDVNNILRDLTYEDAEWIHRSAVPISVGPYDIRYTRRCFEIYQGRSVMKLWDVFGFFQSSFVKALRDNLPEWPTIDEIEAQKKRREDFTFKELELIEHYCDLELSALVALMHDLDKNLVEAGIGQLRAMHGAGSIAGQLLHSNKVRQHIGRHDQPFKYLDEEGIERVDSVEVSEIPAPVLESARYAYAGGRSELWRYGHHRGTFHTYDIRSAYPFAMLGLPSLREGAWSQTTDLAYAGPFSVFKVRYGHPDAMRGYPFFQRLRTGHIFYPPQVEGWYWRPEVEAALSTGNPQAVEILDGWSLEPSTELKPFRFIKEKFQFRAQLTASGKHGAAKVLKLGLNSLYGKTAQTVGGELGRPPRFHNLCWAGYTTSLTRAAVYKAAMQAPETIVFIATDGIGTTAELDLPIGPRLGEWEHKVFDEAVLAQSGVYFLRDGEDGEWKDKYRGFDKGSITAEAIINGWRFGRAKIEAPSTRFIQLGSALTSEIWWRRWRTWYKRDRDLDIHGGGGKRVVVKAGRPHLRLCDLEPNELPGIVASEPYPIKWLGEHWEEALIDGVRESVVAMEEDE